MDILRCLKRNTPAAALSAALAAMVGSAGAVPYSYGYAYNDIFNWSITNFQTGQALPVVGPVYTTEAHAELNGALSTDGAVCGGTPCNVQIQALGTAVGKPDNSFNPIGRTGHYSWGDAVILNPTHATNAGEVYVEGVGLGGGGGRNSLNGSIVLAAPTIVAFGFTAAPYLEAQTTGNKLATDWARVDLNFNITLTDTQGNPVFNWSPDGFLNVPNINEILDSADLNHDLFANPLNPGPLGYSCLGAGVRPFPPPACNFLATTGITGQAVAIPAGVYNLAVSMEEHAHASVPEPASLFLIGSGLMGLAYARQRTRKKA